MTAPDGAATAAAVARFDDAFNRGDVDAVMATMTGDCVFESTTPADGVRYVGQQAVRAAWDGFFCRANGARFETEEQAVFVDRLVARSRYTRAAANARGVDVFRVRQALLAEKLSFVK